VFGRIAENVNIYLSKGSAALVKGRLKLDTWESQDGQRRSKHTILADDIQFLSGKEKNKKDVSTDDEDDRIPF